MQPKSVFIILIIVCISALIAGCANSSGNTATGTITQTSIPIFTTIEPTTVLSTISTATTPVPTITSTPDIKNQITLIQKNDPRIENLQFEKNYFKIAINNCPMQEAFPNIAGDSRYGLKQKIPKITALSAGEYRKFLRDYTEGSADTTNLISISRCEGAVVNPQWNFVQVTAKIIPANPRPANYTFSLNVRSQGKIIARFNTTEQLILGNTITFTSYIPLKMDEMDYFDSVELSYDQQLT